MDLVKSLILLPMGVTSLWGKIALLSSRIYLINDLFTSVIATVLFAFLKTSTTIYLIVFLYAFGANGFFLVCAHSLTESISLTNVIFVLISYEP